MKIMNIKLTREFLIALIAIVVLILVCSVLSYQYIQLRNIDKYTTQEFVTATIWINFTNGTTLKYYITTKNATVYGFLLEAATEGNFSVSATYWGSYDAIFVDSIAGAKGGDGGKWWQYYVNDMLPMVGCDKYIVKNNDFIEWKFEVPTWG